MFAETIRRTREAFDQEAKFTTPEQWETYKQAHYQTWKTVVQALKGAFHERDVVDKAQEKLMRIKQRNRSAEEYILEFECYEINAELKRSRQLPILQIRIIRIPPEEYFQQKNGEEPNGLQGSST